MNAIRDPLADHLLTPQNRMTATDASAAGRRARAFLRKSDRVLGRIFDAHPDFRPRAWLDERPPLDAFGTLVFQVAGQQLPVPATRTIVSRIAEQFGGRIPSPAELLAADPLQQIGPARRRQPHSSSRCRIVRGSAANPTPTEGRSP